ncbi:MAG: endonuclease [Salinivirgaceae bacterium]|nr:endonuclease [Salinivirgaceae bacterium]
MKTILIKSKKALLALNFVIINILFFQVVGMAQIPAGYYDPANGLTGDALKTALNGIIDGHTTYSYSSSATDVYDILKEADKDPNNPDNVIGIYSGFSMNAAAEYNEGDGWNREHVWAKSRGDFGTSRGPGTDCHHIAAEDVSTNSARNNRNFGWGNVQYTDASGSYSGATESKTHSSDWIWEPRDSKKGDVARMILYMVVRYEGNDGEPDLELTENFLSNTDKSPFQAVKSVLLEWNNLDPVSDEERTRNEVVFSYQGNRNPFIDHPEYVCEIFGGTCIIGPTIQNISQSPSNPVATDVVSISADISDEGSITSATLNWGSDNSNLSNSISMVEAIAPTYTISNNIPAQAKGTTIYYTITAVNNDTKTRTSNVFSYSIPDYEPSNYPSSFSTGTLTSSSIQLTWTDASSGILPRAYLIKASTVSALDIVAPVDGTEESDASFVKNVTQGTQTVTFNGLDANTTYYFSIFPYSNSALNIDYKTGETIANTSATTNEASTNAIETFDNYLLTSRTYADGSFTGQDGSTWNYTQCRGDKQITDATLCLGKDKSPDGEVLSGTITGGCGILNFDFMQAFSSNVNMEVFINDDLLTNITTSSQVDLILKSGDIQVNKEGNFTIKFVNTSSSAGQVSIDNISWTPFNQYSSSDNLTICESELPYNYNGKTINTGTTSNEIEFTFTSVSGFDSIVTLDLIVNPTYNTSDELVICQSELPYDYSGQIIPVASISNEIDFSFYSISGCDSIVTLDLTVNSSYSETETATICNGESYTLGSQELSESGEYTETFQSIYGCDSTVTLTLTVNPSYNTSDELVLCQSELPYNYYGKTITEGTTSDEIDFTFNSISGCDSIVTLDLTVNSSYSETETATICNGESYTFGSQELSESGEYSETFQSIYACDSIITLTLTVNPSYNTSDELVLCQSELPYNYHGKTITEGTSSDEIDFSFYSISGCDSIVTLDLTVNSSYSETETATICEGESYTLGSQALSESGEYTETFQSIYGCDSIVNLTLTVNPTYNTSDELVLCQSELPYNYHGKTITEGTTSDEIDFTFNSISGCDSIVTLDLTVNSSYSETETATICYGESYTLGSQELSESGEYTETFQSIYGCDSIVNLTLTVNPTYNTSDELVLCQSELPYNYHGKTITEGTTSDEIDFTFNSISGCDSIVTLDLTVNSSYSETETATICNGESYTFGSQELSESGEYTEIFQSIYGCDSIVTLTLTVISIENGISQDGATLTAIAIDASYQWATCGEKLIAIEGAINQSFIATENGNYAVIINQNECVDSSECYNITGIGIFENSFVQEFALFPNPTNGDLIIDTKLAYNNLQIRIFDISGSQVYLNTFKNENLLNIDLNHLLKGVYTVKIQNDVQIAVYRIIKE